VSGCTSVDERCAGFPSVDSTKRVLWPREAAVALSASGLHRRLLVPAFLSELPGVRHRMDAVLLPFAPGCARDRVSCFSLPWLKSWSFFSSVLLRSLRNACLWHVSHVVRGGWRPGIRETVSVSVAVSSWLASRGRRASSVGQLLLERSKRAVSPSSSYHPVTTFPLPDLFAGHASAVLVWGFSSAPAPVPHRAAARGPVPRGTEGPFGFLPKRRSCRCAQGQNLSPPLLSVWPKMVKSPQIVCSPISFMLRFSPSTERLLPFLLQATSHSLWVWPCSLSERLPGSPFVRDHFFHLTVCVFEQVSPSSPALRFP